MRVESDEVRELRRRNRLLEQEAEVLPRAAAYLSQANLPGKALRARERARGDDPEFGYRLLADETRGAGEHVADRTAWTIVPDYRWWSGFGKKRGRNVKKPSPAVHDDLCTVTDESGCIRHVFTPEAPNHLWPTEIAEHNTGEGKFSLCAMRTGHVLHSDRGSQSRSRGLRRH
ncbi:hypothetical protein [Curtobacterium sp. MCJR17_020]|uniref:hypothetical protein n=1 Tax=Curtobacterium sp. MCJR17_020 TaxID=2175619 RepID=UPI0015E8BCA2|nr:hypothetical protein [Curtobacterium sp. MCJR17_020]WIE70408.1 hypothetical protein DEJ14_009230 [Curtobacterium sp. MCJR17_020]